MGKLKKSLFIFLSALLLLTAATVALLQFLPVTTSAAVEPLEENTATYSFKNDLSYTQGYNTLWRYSRSSNVWQSSGDTAQRYLETTLTLNITKGGDVAFQWMPSSVRPADNGRDAYFKVIKASSGDESEVLSKDTNDLYDRYNNHRNQYSDTITINVAENDELKFVYKGNYGTNSGYINIKGLNIPTETFNVVAQVADDSIGNGEIKTDKAEETFADNKITAIRGYDEKLTFTAVPHEGYVAYWTRNDAYFKAVNAFDEYVSETSAETPFVVHFIRSDSEEIKISYDQPQDDEIGWTGADGAYSIKNLAAHIGETTFNQKLLTFGFVGERWISLNCLYDVPDASVVFVSPYLDGSSYYDLKLQMGVKGEPNLLATHITGDGFHYLEFYLKPSGASSSSGVAYDVKGTEQIILSNFNFSKIKLTTDMAVKYNSDFAELYLDGQPCDDEDATGIVTKTLVVPLAGQFNLEARPRTDIVSSLDETKTTTSQFIEGTANGNAKVGRDESGPPAFEADSQNIVKFAITRNSPKDYSIITRQKGNDRSSISLTLKEGESKLELDLTYKEIAVAPTVSATKTSDGSESGSYEAIEEGQFLGFPFRHDNSLSLRIQKLSGFEAADYSVVVNMLEMNGSLQEYGDMFILPMIVNSNAEVIISFTKQDTDLLIYSSYNLTFNVGENPNGEDVDDTEVSNILHVTSEEAGAGQLEIGKYDVVVFDSEHNTGNYDAAPWKFDAALSEEGNYVYTTSLDFEKTGSGYYRPKTAVKALAFEMSGAEQGSLTFQFKVKGYNNFTDISGAYRGGLLGAYTNTELMSDSVMGWPFSAEYIKKLCGSQDAINYTDPQVGILLAKPGSGDAMEYGGNVITLGDGWCQASIPVKSASYGPCIYLAFITCYEGMAAYPLDMLPSASFSIRDVHLITGTQNATLSVCDEAEGATVTAKVGEAEHHAGDSFSAVAGSTVELSVNTQGKYFYGWTVNGNLVSTEETTKIFLNGESEIKAWIASAGTYEARAEGTFYKTIKDAVENASSGQTVYVIKDKAEITQSFAIGKGVTLLLPYSTAGKLTETGTPDVNSENKIAWLSTQKEKYRYLTVTVRGNVTITVNGTLAVGGIVNYPKGQGYQGHTSGAYSELILEKGSKIQVAKDGVMDVYGRIWGGEGKTGTEMGTIDVAAGGKLYQPFLILDYTGGSDALSSFSDQKTPFKRYAMINIECPMTIHYGGQLLGHASLWVETMKLLASLDQPFITDENGDGMGSDTFVMLHEGASVTITYDSTKTVNNASVVNCTEGIGKTTMIFEGGATFSYMRFSAMGLTVPTNVVYFSIPYNYNVSLNKGEKSGEEINPATYNQYETVTDFMIMPGAVVTVGEGATLTLNANAWVYDGLNQSALHQKWYPTAEELNKAGYSKSGNLIIDGTLKTGKKTPVPRFELLAPGDSDFDDAPIPATFLGIVQTTGNGRIEILDGAAVEGTISDGISGSNYFAYTTTARVWDAAHNCFGNLEAGHTYTATSGDPFTLSELKYSDTKDSKEDNLTLKLGVTMRGSWKIEHVHHQYDWTLKEGEKDFGSEKTKDITRQCTELGCKEHETHKLLYTLTDLNLGDITFKNSAITEDDIKELLKAYYGADVEGLIKTIQIDESRINHGQNYLVTVTLNEDSFFWAEGAAKDSFVFKWNIKEAEITEITLSSAEKPYDGEAITKEIVTKVVAGELQLSAIDYDVNITLKNGGENSANVGVYTVTVTGKNNYKGTISKDFTIKQVEITIDVKDDLTATYAGSKNAPEIPAEAYEQTGKTVGNDSITVNVKYKNGVNEWKAGESFVLTAEAVIKNGNAQNYKITVNDGSLTVNKKPVTLKVKDKNATYSDGSAYDVVWELEGAEDFGDDFDSAAILALLTITCDVNENNEAGKHTINVKWTSDDQTFENFEVTLTTTAEYTITPAEYGELHFGGDETVVYDGKPHERTLTLDDETVTVKIYYKLHGAGDGEYKEQKPVNAGTYDVKAELQSDNYNNGGVYTFTTGGRLTIDKASISEVTITGEYEYDGEEKTLQVTVKTANGLTLTANDYTVNCDNLTNAQESIPYSVTAKTDNYTGTASTNFTIAKKAATVKINNQSKVYDMTAPNLSQTEVTKEGFVDGEDIGLQLSLVTSAADVNDYRIKYEVTKANVANNYNITYCTSDGKTIDDNNYPKYSITRKQATISVGNLTSVYGEEVKTNYEYTSEGFLSDGYTPQLSYECSVIKGTAKGDYEITATVTNEHKNYDITVNKGKYQVTARAITITVNSGTSVYGDVIPAELAGYEITQGEKYGDDNLQVTLTRDAGTDAGIYNITAECGNTNYSATIVQGKWTITQKPVTGIMVIVSDGTNDYSDSGDGVIHAKFGGQPLTISAGAPNPYQDLHVETSVTEITETGSYTVTARIVETNYSGEITVKIEVAPDLSIALERLAALKAQLSGEELTAEDFGIMKQINDLINGLAEEDRESDELNEYKELIESWNAAAGIDEEIITQANSLADEIISGIIAAISAAAAIAYVAIFGGKAI